jgi:hypothetical protein
MFQVFALDERTAKFLQKVSGPLRNPIFFSGGGAHEGHTNLGEPPRALAKRHGISRNLIKPSTMPAWTCSPSGPQPINE